MNTFETKMLGKCEITKIFEYYDGPVHFQVYSRTLKKRLNLLWWDVENNQNLYLVYDYGDWDARSSKENLVKYIEDRNKAILSSDVLLMLNEDTLEESLLSKDDVERMLYGDD